MRGMITYNSFFYSILNIVWLILYQSLKFSFLFKKNKVCKVFFDFFFLVLFLTVLCDICVAVS